jgi:hypothetical protein
MCIQAFALCLARVKNIQVGLIKWYVDAENPDLELSLDALDVVDDANGSGIQVASSSHRGSSFVEHASCSIFYDEDEDQYDM